METESVLIVAMAARCRDVIRQSSTAVLELPKPVQPQHLLWMCDRIEAHSEVWPLTKLHRWIGFVQCGMLAHGMLDLPGIKRIFDQVKMAHGGTGQDQTLIDHLDADNPFELDIGGQG